MTRRTSKGEAKLMRTTSFAIAAAAALVIAAPATSKTLPQLFGTVGPSSTFMFKDKAGKRVKVLKPGKYTLSVQDFSKAQNFHVVGPGLNVKTSLRGKGSSGWAVVLKAGTFRYYSDGSPIRLRGSFTVRR
jgi:uncharacterized protein YaiE (UPF0345 family)